MYYIKLVTSLQKKSAGFVTEFSIRWKKTFVVLEYDFIKRWQSILLWCKNIFLIAQERGLEWRHESYKVRGPVQQC